MSKLTDLIETMVKEDKGEVLQGMIGSFHFEAIGNHATLFVNTD